MLKVSDGRHDEAWQDLLACHRLARLTATGGNSISGSVGRAIEQMSVRADLALVERMTGSAKTLGYLRDLQALLPMLQLADEWDTGQRFEFLNELMMVNRHGLKYLAALGDGHGGNLSTGLLVNVNWDPGLRFANRWFDNIVVAMREKDRPTRQKRFEQIVEQMKEFKAKRLSQTGREELAAAVLNLDLTPEARGEVFTNILMGLMMSPNVVRGPQINSERIEQGQRNLHVAFALAAYQGDHKSYPKSLDALVPNYLPEVPDDLFTDKPLVYRPSGNGYLLYSLGPDGKDDEGRMSDYDPKGDDIAVHVPVRSRPRNDGVVLHG